MTLTNSTVSILGCGWLGLPLGNYLAEEGYKVKGSTTSPGKIDLLKENKITPYILNLEDELSLENCSEFFNSDNLIVSFPPRIRAGKGENYLNQINLLASLIQKSSIKNILFVSSTSVYPDLNKVITEEELFPEGSGQNILLSAEKIIQETLPGQVTILRFSGLVGGTRHPGRFFAGKTQVANPQAPVNLIHLDDCIRIISEIMKQGKWGKTYNACSDEHPTREAFYKAAAKAIDLTPPEFAEPSSQNSYKIISNSKLKAELNYQFLHPDPLKFI